jgi:hypothetical protein
MRAAPRRATAAAKVPGPGELCSAGFLTTTSRYHVVVSPRESVTFSTTVYVPALSKAWVGVSYRR